MRTIEHASQCKDVIDDLNQLRIGGDFHDPEAPGLAQEAGYRVESLRAFLQDLNREWHQKVHTHTETNRHTAVHKSLASSLDAHTHTCRSDGGGE